MNNDLANFTVEFTTKGFKEVRDDIKELGDKMDDLAGKMNSMKTHGGWLNDFLGGLETKILALGTAIAGLGIKKAFDVKNQVLDLEQLSVLSGVAAQNIEALGLALKFSGVRGGDINTAGNFYRNLQDFREKLMRDEISEAQAKEWGISNLKLNPAASLGEFIWTMSSALSNLNSAGETAKMNMLADSFGLDDPMRAFLLKGPETVQAWLKKAGGEAWRYDPEKQAQSQKLNENWEIFKNRFDKWFSDEWLKAVNGLVDTLNLLEPTLGKLVNHLGGVFGDDIRIIADIIKAMNGENALGQLADKFAESQKTAENMGEIIGMALGAIIGALIGHPVLGALVGRQVGGNIAHLIYSLADWFVGDQNTQSTIDLSGVDFDEWKQFADKTGKPLLSDYKRAKELGWIPENTQWFAGMSMDLLRNMNANTINISLDPTKTTDITMNPDGTWTTRDGRGMTILQSGVM